MSTKASLLLDASSCLNKASADEPVFLLRANDPVAAQAIRHWATMSVHYHSDSKRQDALDVAAEFERWLKQQPQPAPAEYTKTNTIIR